MRADRCNPGEQSGRENVLQRRRDPYDEYTIQELTRIISRSSINDPVSVENLHSRLSEVFEGVPIYHPPSNDLMNTLPEDQKLLRLWNERDWPSDKQLAEVFEHATLADDPVAIIAEEHTAYTHLRLQLRKRERSHKYQKDDCRPNLLDEPWISMSKAERTTVLEQIHQLGTYYKSQVPNGRLDNTALNTVLFGLASLFVSFAGLTHHEYKLPHSVNSQFIQFAALATKPYFYADLTTDKALSARWKRQKKRHGS